VAGDGAVRRCHFLDEVIGNIYDADFPACLKPRLCGAATCGCHIGYIHRPELKLETLYGEGLLERIPSRWPELITAYGHATKSERGAGQEMRE
jgi:hypothetical protein